MVAGCFRGAQGRVLLCSLIDTTFIGHIGPIELAAVGVSIAIFNQVSKVAEFPLVSITTSYVAEEETMSRVAAEHQSEKALPEDSNATLLEDKSLNPGKDLPGDKDMTELEKNNISLENPLPGADSGQPVQQPTSSIAESDNVTNLVLKKKYLSSASSAIVIGLFLGVFQAVLLIFTAKPLLHIMGIKAGSPKRITRRLQLLRHGFCSTLWYSARGFVSFWGSVCSLDQGYLPRISMSSAS